MEPHEWPSGQLVDGRTAGPILRRVRVVIEAELLRRTQANFAAAWLFFLRRQSPAAYNAKNLYSFNYAGDIAETITGLGGSAELSRYVDPDFSYVAVAAERLDEVEWFCKAALALKNLHAIVRIADKGALVLFRAGDKPLPQPNAQQQEAMSLYDRRSPTRFVGATVGTILGGRPPLGESDLSTINGAYRLNDEAAAASAEYGDPSILAPST